MFAIRDGNNAWSLSEQHTGLSERIWTGCLFEISHSGG